MLIQTQTTETIPRGVSSEILLNYIKNTAPYLFGENFYPLTDSPCFTYLRELDKNTATSLDHADYFRMCVSAHFATVATFVPTDVDNQIRFKLWHPSLDIDVIERMIITVEESLFWNVLPVTKRFVRSFEKNDVISGHHGEWFSIAAGAYGATRKKDKRRSKDILQKIVYEIEREGRILTEFIDNEDGENILKASMLISHNLGDLNRVIEMWNLDESDALAVAAVNTSDKKYLNGVFTISSELNRLFMAPENHRHFKLRAPKALRRDPNLLLGLGPYFDNWGRNLVTSQLLSDEELGEVTEALIDGWAKLDKTFGYARAISGIEEALGGPKELGKLLPARLKKFMLSGKLRTLISIPKAKFEGQWNNMAIKWIRSSRTVH